VLNELASVVRYFNDCDSIGDGWSEGWEGLYGVSKHAWLSTFLVLANGIPSEDTFRRVFERIDPKQFEDCFEGWVKQLVNELGFK